MTGIKVRHKQSGFTLMELMVAMVVGLFLLGGVMFTYLSMKVTTTDTVEMGELQETGRIALDLLHKDISMTGFFGRLNVSSVHSSDITGVTNPGNDCTFGLNNASFPNAAAGTNFRVLFGREAQAASELNCITDAVVGSDIIQIKRAAGLDVSGQTMNANQFYVETTLADARFITGGGTALDVAGTQVWPYEHHVYYIAEQTYTTSSGNVTVPVLMRKRLTVGGGMITESVLEGVENIRFIYGIDTNGDANVDEYKSATQMTETDWQQSSLRSIETVQVYVLVRAIRADNDSTITNQTYVLGGEGADRRTLTFNDNFRRMVFVSTVKLNNSGNIQWDTAL